jgi:ABC-2 type transport system permease protein
MHKIFSIIRYEYRRHVRRRSFLFASFGIPLLIVGAMGLVVLLLFNIRSEERLGMVDQTGRFASIDPETLNLRRTIPIERFPDQEVAQQALESERIDAYFLIPVDYLETGTVRVVSPDPISDRAESQIRALLQAGLLAEVFLADRERLAQPTDLVLRTLDGDHEISGDSFFLFFLPYVFAVMFLITSFTTSGYLLQAIAEEKEDRVIEILATTVSPRQILAGKIIGLSAVGLTQILIWVITGVVAVLIYDPNWLMDVEVPWSMLGLSLVYFLFGYLLIATCYATIGAAVTTPQEAQPLAGPISLLTVAPMMLHIVILAHPNGLLAVVFSLIPFSAPMTMLMRLPLADIPTWQLLVSLGGLLLTVFGAMLLAARVMRLGMLRYGKRLSLGEMFGFVRA